MRRLLLSLATLLTLAAPAAASVVLRMDLPDLSQRADLIVQARCVSVAVERGARGLPVTRVRLAVDRSWRGAEAGQVLEFTLPGGSLDGRRLVLPGLPRFAAGEELVLFLSRPSRDGHRLPVGLGQGRFLVSRDPVSGAASLSRSLRGVELVSLEPGQEPSPAELARVSFEQLEQHLDGLGQAALDGATTETR